MGWVAAIRIESHTPLLFIFFKIEETFLQLYKLFFRHHHPFRRQKTGRAGYAMKAGV